MPWTMLWGGFAFWVVVASLMSGDISQAVMWFFQALFAIFLGLAFSYFRKIWSYLAFAILAVLVTTLAIHSWSQARQWQSFWGASNSVIEPSDYEQSWIVVEADSFPSGNREFIYQTFRDGNPIKGRNFRVTISLKTGSTRGGVLSLLAANPFGAYSSLPVQATNEWSELELVWRVPEGVNSRELRIGLSGFIGSEIWINYLTVEEEVMGGWQLVKDFKSVGISVQKLEGSSVNSRQPVAPKEQLVFRLGKSDLVANQGFLPWSKKRQHVITNHPNLDGHTIGLLGATTLLLPAPFSVVGALVTIVGIGLTGSRISWIMINFVLVMWALLRLSRRWMFLAIGAVIFVNAGLYFVATSGSERLSLVPIISERLSLVPASKEDSSSQMSRPEIWRYALASAFKNPITGTSQSFDSMLEDNFIGKHRPFFPKHAHNFVLQMAFQHGIFGAIAALWVTVGILLIGFRWGGIWGLTYGLLPIILNLPDFTFFFVGVLAPMTLGLNLIRSESYSAIRNGES